MTQEQETKIRKIVNDYLNKQPFINFPSELSIDEREHVIDMGTEIMANKWGINDYPPGSFVNAVIGNKLTETFSNADSTNLRFIHFYVLLMYNVGMPSNL